MFVGFTVFEVLLYSLFLFQNIIRRKISQIKKKHFLVKWLELILEVIPTYILITVITISLFPRYMLSSVKAEFVIKGINS